MPRLIDGDFNSARMRIEVPTLSNEELRVLLGENHESQMAAERRWFVDVFITPDEHACFSFVRLGLARYQSNAIETCEL